MVFTQLSELPMTAYQKVIYPKNTASKQSLLWLEKQRDGVSTFIMLDVGMGVRDGYQMEGDKINHLSTVTTTKRGLFFNTTATASMDVQNVFHTCVTKYFWMLEEKNL